MDPFERERQTLEERARQYQDHAGKFVVVHGREVLGPFVSEDEAYAAGARHFPHPEPFLLRQLGQAPQQVDIPGLMVRLLDDVP